MNDQASPLQYSHAFLWSKQTGIRDLGTLPGDAVSVGSAINDAGQVVGPSFDPLGNPRAYLWQNGTMYDLNSLVVGGAPLYLLFGTAINASGEISGFGLTPGGDVHAFLASPTNGKDAKAAIPAPEIDDHLREAIRQLPFGRFGVGLRR